MSNDMSRGKLGRDDSLERRVDDLRREIDRSSMQLLAEKCGAEYHTVEDASWLLMSFFDLRVKIPVTDLVVCDLLTDRPLPVAIQAVLLYYLRTADGTPHAGHWIAFADLPDGRFYNQAFQGYTGDRLAKTFGDDLESFSGAAQRIGGSQIAYSDAGFVFHVLPRLAVAVVAYRGDEDFSPRYQLLFDSSAGHYLPTDVCAVLGSMLTQRLILA